MSVCVSVRVSRRLQPSLYGCMHFSLYQIKYIYFLQHVPIQSLQHVPIQYLYFQTPALATLLFLYILSAHICTVTFPPPPPHTPTHPTINQPIPARKIPHRQGRNYNIRIRLSCIYLYLTSVCVYIYANVYVTLSSAYIDRLLHRSIYTFNRTLYLENHLCAYVRTQNMYTYATRLTRRRHLHH